jgi:hypothetical protein
MNYEGVSKGFRTGRLERKLPLGGVVSSYLVSFAAITHCVSSRVFILLVYFVVDSVRKVLDTPSYICCREAKRLVRRTGRYRFDSGLEDSALYIFILLLNFCQSQCPC